jgi:hypothetical protein
MFAVVERLQQRRRLRLVALDLCDERLCLLAAGEQLDDALDGCADDGEESHGRRAVRVSPSGQGAAVKRPPECSSVVVGRAT